MRLDIGIASYGNPERLRATLQSIAEHTASDRRIFVIHNPGAPGDAEAREVISAATGRSIIPVWCEQNGGYAGAVNRLFVLAETEFIAYCDNDIDIRTPGWDERLIDVMESNPEVGWMFPGSGHYGFFNGKYHECLWNAGYCWILRRAAMMDVANKKPGPPIKDWGFDTVLGHHEEVDYMIRLRLAGWRVGCRPDVNVIHHESATRANDANHKPGGRIHDGVVQWMNKWNRYFCGDELEYSITAYDARALRYTDWNVDALYLERMTLAHLPEWNKRVETVLIPGVGEMDAVKVLKPKGPYRGRAI